MAHVGQELGLDPRRLQRGVARVFERHLGLLEFAHVPRDADDARDRAGLVVNRHLGHGGPALAPIPVDEPLQLVDERLAGANDALLVAEKLVRQHLRVIVEICFAHDLHRVFQAQPPGHGTAHAEKARLHVLEINPVRDVLEQGAEQIAFVGQRLLGFLALGHVPEDALDADDVPGRVVDGRLDDVDVDAVPVRGLVGLDGVHRFTGGHDAQIIGVILVRQGGGEKIVVGPPDDLLLRLAQRRAKLLIHEDEPALRVLAEDVLRQRFHERLVEDLGRLERILSAALFEEAALQIHQMAAQIQLGHDLVGEDAQGFLLRRGEPALAHIRHEQGPNVEAVRRAEGGAGKEPDVRLLRDQRGLGEARIAARIFHDEQIVAENGMAARRAVARQFTQGDADLAFEPETLFIHEHDDGHRHGAVVRGHLGQVVEDRFGQRVEHVVAAQRSEALRFVDGKPGAGRGILHRRGGAM